MPKTTRSSSRGTKRKARVAEKKKTKGRAPVPSRPVSALSCNMAYVCAALAGFWAFQNAGGVTLLSDYGWNSNPFWKGIFASVVATVTVWFFSVFNNNSSIYDPFWVVAPPALAVLLKSSNDSDRANVWHGRQILILLSLLSWSCRYHVFYPWAGWWTGLTEEDWRYEDMRSAPIPYWFNSLLNMHMFPTVLVYFAFDPAALVLTRAVEDQPELGLIDGLGFLLSITAVAIQYFADQQLRNFRATGSYKKGISFQSGLWKYSRHPNYFGETLFWISMIPYSIGSTDYESYTKLCVIGPIVMFLFFRFSSTLMDARSLKHRPDYQRVIDETSCMVPWWPKQC